MLFVNESGVTLFFKMCFGIVTGVVLTAAGRMNDARVREDAEPA